jgi:hypothetical protein
MKNFRSHTSLTCALVLGTFAVPILSLAQDETATTGFGRHFELLANSDDAVLRNHFRVGALVGLNLKAQFSMSGSFAFSGKNPGATGVRGVAHEYDDGFVRVDATGNDVDSTYYWSYNDASQYDNTLNRLTFHSANSYTTGSSGNATADPQIGVDAVYGGHLLRFKNTLIGWEFGYGFLPINIADKLSGAATVTRSSYWYDTSNLGSAFFIDPGTGNTLGSYTGTEAGPGAKLDDRATAGASDIVAGTLTGTRTLDVTLHNFRLGPTLHWELHPRIALAISGGAAMGIVSGELQFDETLVLPGGSAPNNSGSFSDTQMTYGSYLAGKLMYHAEENGDFYIAVQYMPLGSVNFSGGGREAKLNMSGGLYISAGINWPF